MRQGFTLVETLVALLIMSVALVVLVNGQFLAARADCRARETACVRRALESLSAESLAGVLTNEQPPAFDGCVIQPVECRRPESGPESVTWHGRLISSSNEPSIGARLFSARETTR